MARRGREGIAKRARERARQARQKEKRLRRQSGAAASEPKDLPDESGLMEEFRVLSERHAAGLIAEDLYTEEKQRIFTELGINTDGTT